MPIGTWTVLPVTETLTSPRWTPPPPPPPPPAFALGRLTAVHALSPPNVFVLSAATVTSQTLAATPIGTWIVLPVRSTLTRPSCWAAGAGAAASPRQVAVTTAVAARRPGRANERWDMVPSVGCGERRQPGRRGDVAEALLLMRVLPTARRGMRASASDDVLEPAHDGRPRLGVRVVVVE